MPIVALTLGVVVKFGAKKLTAKAVASATKMKINSTRLVKAKQFLLKRGDTIAEIIGDMSGGITAILIESWGGDDYEKHAAAHKELVEACRDMQDAVCSCANYLQTAADRYDAAQTKSKSEAGALPTAR